MSTHEEVRAAKRTIAALEAQLESSRRENTILTLRLADYMLEPAPPMVEAERRKRLDPRIRAVQELIIEVRSLLLKVAVPLQAEMLIDLSTRLATAHDGLYKVARELRREVPPRNALDRIADRLHTAVTEVDASDQGPLSLDLAILIGAARDHECANCTDARLNPPSERPVVEADYGNDL